MSPLRSGILAEVISNPAELPVELITKNLNYLSKTNNQRAKTNKQQPKYNNQEAKTNKQQTTSKN